MVVSIFIDDYINDFIYIFTEKNKIIISLKSLGVYTYLSKLESPNNYNLIELKKKIEYLSNENDELKKIIKKQKNILLSVSEEKNKIYDSLTKHQTAYAQIIMQKDSDIQSFEKELLEYIEEKSDLQRQINKLTFKSKQYDKLQGNLLKIQLKAESTALRMIEDAQSQAMEAIAVIDDIEKEISLFMIDIDKLREDLKIGTITTEDRLRSICYKFNHYLEILKGIKKSFYVSNNLIIPE